MKHILFFLSLFNLSILFAQDGAVDTGFMSGSGTDSSGMAAVIQSDDKILIGGNFTEYNGTPVSQIVRLNNDGTLDTSFATGKGTNAMVTSIAVRPNGKIIIGGEFTKYNGVAVNRI